MFPGAKGVWGEGGEGGIMMPGHATYSTENIHSPGEKERGESRWQIP